MINVYQRKVFSGCTSALFYRGTLVHDMCLQNHCEVYFCLFNYVPSTLLAVIYKLRVLHARPVQP